MTATTLGHHLRARREALGLTQTDLAQKAGFTQAAISAWELGLRTPGALALHSLAATLETTLTELAGILADPDNDDDEVPA
jgi:transcriptional regulator with XRE-family HTH domain